jgi:hypothetical protein
MLPEFQFTPHSTFLYERPYVHWCVRVCVCVRARIRALGHLRLTCVRIP